MFAKRLVLVLALLAISSLVSAARQPDGPVKHWVVLMMENRAYDHLLGYFQMDGVHLQGLTGREYNHWDSSNPNSGIIRVNNRAKDVSPDPDHSVNGTTWQIFGTPYPEPGAPVLMNGFVSNSRVHLGDRLAPRIMECWDPANLPIITTLAKNYVLFDEWHASIPGPTYGNRMYWHAATSDGYCTNKVPADGFQIKTVYELLDESGYDWAFYFDQVQDASFFNYTRQPRFANRMRTLKQFKLDSDAGTLPTLSFMLPRFFSEPGIPGNDQHPNHAVSIGEQFIKTVYEELRQSRSWLSSAFVLTYDEHGGFYDHVATPVKDVPNPDGKMCHDPVRFGFDRLGLRIPTVLISPWVDHGVVHNPEGVKPHPNSKFEHSSFIATLTRMLKLNGPLTKRDAWAAPFDYLFTRTTPRTDCPETLPPVDHPAILAYHQYKANAPEHLQPLHELQISYLQAANAMAGLHPEANLHLLRTEHEGAQYIHTLMEKWHQASASVEQQ